MRCVSILLMLFTVLASDRKADAANFAYDQADDLAYAYNWTNGSNGGFGFASWQIFTLGTNSDAIIQSSTVNGDNSNNDSDIDTPDSCWGLIAGEASLIYAIRPFTGGGLTQGQSFSGQFDFGADYDPVKSGKTIGFFDDTISLDLFAIFVRTNSPTLFYFDAAGIETAIPMPNDDEGYWFHFVMTGPTSYWAQVSSLHTGGVYSWTGELIAAPGAFYAANSSVETGSTADEYRMYINRISVIPEPRVLALMLTAASLWGVREVRRRISGYVGRTSRGIRRN